LFLLETGNFLHKGRNTIIFGRFSLALGTGLPYGIVAVLSRVFGPRRERFRERMATMRAFERAIACSTLVARRTPLVTIRPSCFLFNCFFLTKTIRGFTNMAIDGIVAQCRLMARATLLGLTVRTVLRR